MIRQPQECYITLEALQQLINSGCKGITVIVNGQYYDIKEDNKYDFVNDPVTTD